MASRVNLPTIEQGATYTYKITVTNSDGTNTDFTTLTEARLQIRATRGSSTALVDAKSTGASPQITISGNVLTLTLSAAVTAALDFTSGVYDLELAWNDGKVDRLMEGQVQLSKEVTR